MSLYCKCQEQEFAQGLPVDAPRVISRYTECTEDPLYVYRYICITCMVRDFCKMNSKAATTRGDLHTGESWTCWLQPIIRSKTTTYVTPPILVQLYTKYHLYSSRFRERSVSYTSFSLRRFRQAKHHHIIHIDTVFISNKHR